MTLATRLGAALAVTAIVPTALVVVVPILSANRRAGAETATRVAQANRQLAILVEDERRDVASDADRAAESLHGDHDALAAVLRGPEAAADPVAREIGERAGFDRARITGRNDATLATWGAGAPRRGTLTEHRTVEAPQETLTLTLERDLGDRFLDRVAAVTGSPAQLTDDPATACGLTRADASIDTATTLCVPVRAADAAAVRRELLRSFAGIAAIAAAAALILGGVIASRIAAPIRALTERAEAISERHGGPLTLLPETDETRRLTRAFDRMLDGLAASEEKRAVAERVAAWEEMARRLAHEVKNPLSPIQLAVENLRRARARSPEAFDRALEEETATILEEVGSLRALVDEFAQFARLPRVTPAPCDPRAIVAGALALYASRAAASGVRVVVDDAGAPTSIHADAEQLSRALKNVVQNALDAMEGAPRRELTITVRPDGTGTAFEVADTGPGFDAKVLGRVFEPYLTTRRESGGTGLGLAIAQRIVAEHGGTIRAGNREGGGAVVVLVI